MDSRQMANPLEAMEQQELAQRDMDNKSKEQEEGWRDSFPPSFFLLL